MRLSQLSIKHEYRSFSDNIVRNFYIPALEKAVSYKRAVGYFSSSALIELSQGITGLKRNHGTIKMIASPYISGEDIEAMQHGYKKRDEIVYSSLISQLKEPTSYFEKERLNLLANLLADGVLDIRIAFTNNEQQIGMYHEKMGIISDNVGNKIAFSGSMNESITAFQHNYETIDVFCSWNGDESRVQLKESAFERIWNSEEKNVRTEQFLDLSQEIIDKYKTKAPNFQIDKEEFASVEKAVLGASMPENIQLYDYQIEAIDSWEKQGFCGIFDMATGTGKTYTGLGAIARLSEKVEAKLAVFIVCPYQHLVEQWVEDIEAFGINPIIAYSASSQKDWKKRLSDAILDQKLGVPNKDFLCVVSTNATFSSDFVQSEISKIGSDALLVVDEAHNFGANHLQKTLSKKFNYRLALSATIKRHRDEEGTKALFDYFGDRCIEYTLERAIKEEKLTQYKYYPIIVHLDSDEFEEYENFTREISRCLKKGANGAMSLNSRGKMLALRRSRVVAGAKNKISALEREIEPYINDGHTLVYCGATKLLDPTIDDSSDVDESEKRQIDIVTNRLGNTLGMKISQFTARENVVERDVLKKKFAEGDLQALIAIRCLDEGVNIPSIKRAFILASTTNPKEYIQRRGRVLRRYAGKEFAEIFDFITLPRPLEEAPSLSQQQVKREITLVKNELARAQEFARIAMNKFESEAALREIKNAYDIKEHQIQFEEDYTT